MPTAPRYELTHLASGQANAEVLVNSAIDTVDAFAGLCVLEGRDVQTPSLTVVGTCFHVGAGGTGDFAGHDGKIMQMTESGWRPYTITQAVGVFLKNENKIGIYNGNQFLTADLV